MRKKRKAAMKARRKAKKEFYNKTYPINFAIDSQWKSRMTQRPAVVSCFWGFNHHTPWPKKSDMPRNQWVDCMSRPCPKGSLGDPPLSCRHIKIPKRPDLFRYSGSSDRPEMPELMKRIDAGGVQIPPRFHCRIDDVVQGNKQRSITCDAQRDDKPVIRVSGELSMLNVGDVVSVPLAGSNLSEPVLTKTRQGPKRAEHLSWTVSATAESVKVESAATCPSAEEVVEALK